MTNFERIKAMSVEKMAEELAKIDWVQNGKAFKREVKFKLLPANSKENNIFAIIY